MTIEEKIHSILGQYRNDEVMLDAFFQWATNPTKQYRGYGIEENYPYIQKNLVNRYGMPSAQAKEYVDALKKACDLLLSEAGGDVYAIRNAIVQGVSQEGYSKVLKLGMIKRLEKASEATKKALLLFNILKNVISSVTADTFTEPREQYRNRQEEFQAYYKTLYGEVAPILNISREIVRIGAYNELWYIGNKASSVCLQEAIIPSSDEIEGLGIKLPPISNAESLVESFWQKEEFEILRFVDIISHSSSGIVTTDEPLPTGANILGFMGSYGKSIALSPNIINQVKQRIELMKDQKMELMRKTLEKALVAVERQTTPDGILGVLWTGQGETVWRFSTTPPLYVYLAPWLTTSTQTVAPSRVNFQEKPHVLFVIPCQSRASFLTALERHSGFSLKETRWEKSIGLLTNLLKPAEFQLLVGNRHPLLEKIFEAISETSGASPQPAPVAADEVVKPKETAKPKAPSERPTSPDTQGPLGSAGKGLGILLGTRGSEKIFWYPGAERSWNFAIVGSAGTGKTQTVKAVLREFSQQQIPYIVFDFRNDYVPPKSSSCDFGSVLALSSISINPLELDGSSSPRDQKYQVSDIIALVYAIGERQIGYVREAIKISYENRGIHEDSEETWKQSPPTFADIQQNLEHLAEEGARAEKESIKGIFARLDPIFDYGIFSSKTVMPFEELVGNCTVINLGILPNDNLKAVVCEFLLRKLRYYLYSLPESREPRLFIIVDEAHRLKYEKSSSTGQLLKEARKYGVGLILSTQDPVDFPDLVYNNIGGILSLQLTDPKYAKSVAEHLGGQVSWQSVKNELSEKFAAFVKFSSHPNAIRLRVTPYYERSNE